MLKNQNFIYQNFLIHFENSVKYPEGNFLDLKQIFHPQLKDEMHDEEINAAFLVMGVQLEILTPLLKKNLQKVLIYMLEVEEEIKLKEFDDKIKLVPIQKFYFNSSGNKKYMQIFHPKIFIIKFKNFIRILIGTPNLFIGDWAVFNQIFYLKDFPLISKNKKTQQENQFKKNLIYYMKKSLKDDYQQILKFSNINLDDYDIQQDNTFQLAWSFPGLYYRGNKRTSGLFHIENLIKQTEFQSKYTLENTTFTYVTSSLGKFTVEFLRNLLIYFLPIFQKQKITKKDLQKIFRLIYPDKEMMEENKKFEEVFGTCLFYREQDLNDENNVNDIFYKCKKKEKHKQSEKELFPHVKCILIKNSDKINDDTIFYFGSHNCSTGAWGRIYSDIKIYNSNTELGMLMVPQKGSKEIKQKIVDNLIIEIENPQKYTDKDELYVNFQIILNSLIFLYFKFKQCIHIKLQIQKERYLKHQQMLIEFFILQKTIQQVKIFMMILLIYVPKQNKKQQIFQSIKTIIFS